MIRELASWVKDLFLSAIRMIMKVSVSEFMADKLREFLIDGKHGDVNEIG
jgi:hypothetical protein